jgi:hypothetical protein
VPGATLDGVTWDPYETAAPHAYSRTSGPDFADLPLPVEIVASEEGSGGRGGADPTVADLGEDEILFHGDFGPEMPGWTAPGGAWPPLGTAPDVLTGLTAAAPDAVTDPDAALRLYYVDATTGAVRVATSEDAHTWTVLPGPATDEPGAHGVSVARDPDGTWWMYFDLRDVACMEAG